MAKTLHLPATEVGQKRDGRPIEWSDKMTAAVYFGQGDVEVVDDRPIVCTDEDIVVSVDRVYRCGTDVKIYYKGRPDQCEESLIDELRTIYGISEPAGDVPFTKYSDLARKGEVDQSINDPLYKAIAAKIEALPAEQREQLPEYMNRHWGRILGHETVVTVQRVGSKVAENRQGLGYFEGMELTEDQVTFEPGQKCVLQSRIAYYEPPPNDRPEARGVQLLGGNITDLAMNLGGAYADYIRLTPEIIRSGSVVKIPSGVSFAAASLAEPTACLLDCFQKSTHEIGQDEHGSILVKGVKPGGVTCVIGSGSMALMAGLLARMEDPIIRMGKARELVYVVRSKEKAEFVRRVLHDQPVSTIVCAEQDNLPQTIREQYAGKYEKDTGQPFRGFDDVILGAGDAETVGISHELIASTGARLMMFAGTRGPTQVDSGVWHYANAGVIGTSGCNTKMMEISLGLFARGSLDPSRLAGKVYTFDDLKAEGGIEAFFGDKNLRPCLEPGGSN